MHLLRLTYAGIFIAAIVMFWQAYNLPAAYSPRDIGPGIFPMWLSGFLIALCPVALFVDWNKSQRVDWRQIVAPVLVLLLLALAVRLATKFGFFAVMPVALLLGLYLCGSRSHIANVLFSILMPALCWLVFAELLQVPLGKF